MLAAEKNRLVRVLSVEEIRLPAQRHPDFHGNLRALAGRMIHEYVSRYMEPCRQAGNLADIQSAFAAQNF